MERLSLVPMRNASLSAILQTRLNASTPPPRLVNGDGVRRYESSRPISLFVYSIGKDQTVGDGNPLPALRCGVRSPAENSEGMETLADPFAPWEGVGSWALLAGALVVKRRRLLRRLAISEVWGWACPSAVPARRRPSPVAARELLPQIYDGSRTLGLRFYPRPLKVASWQITPILTVGDNF